MPKLTINAKIGGYFLGIILLIVGFAGIFVSSCETMQCCQSFFAQAIRSNKCAEITYYGERPWSVEFVVAGLFAVIATRLLTK